MEKKSKFIFLLMFGTNCSQGGDNFGKFSVSDFKVVRKILNSSSSAPKELDVELRAEEIEEELLKNRSSSFKLREPNCAVPPESWFGFVKGKWDDIFLLSHCHLSSKLWQKWFLDLQKLQYFVTEIKSRVEANKLLRKIPKINKTIARFYEAIIHRK